MAGWSRSPTTIPAPKPRWKNSLPVADIPASYGEGARSKVVGLVDAPGNRLVFSLYDAGEIWVADLSDPAEPEVRKFANVGVQPYDALITPDGRYYVAGLFGEDGVALLDLWNLDQGVHRVLDGYGQGEEPLPVYKMPHLQGWAEAGDLLFLPAIGRPVGPRLAGKGRVGTAQGYASHMSSPHARHDLLVLS